MAQVHLIKGPLRVVSIVRRSGCPAKAPHLESHLPPLSAPYSLATRAEDIYKVQQRGSVVALLPKEMRLVVFSTLHRLIISANDKYAGNFRGEIGETTLSTVNSYVYRFAFLPFRFLKILS
jgi:hypothetical protein